jgi:tetratricopeptide (TPR) repeat protein
MKIATLLAISLGLIICGGPTIVQAQPQPPSETTIAPKPGMAELQAAIKRDPKNLSAYYNLANYYGKDEPDEVVKIFDRVIAIAPSNPEIYEKFAMMATDYEYQGAPLQAIARRLITAQKAFPKSPKISIYLAGLYGHSKQPDKAIAALQQGLKNGGDAKEFNMLLGHIELGLNKNPDRALRYYEKVVQIGGDYLCADPYRSWVLMEPLIAQGKAPEAFALLKSTLQKSSGEAQKNCIMAFYGLSEQYPPIGKETIALISPIVLAQKETNRVEFMELTALMMKQKQYAEVIALGDRLLAEKRSVPLLPMMDIVNAAKELKQFEKAEQWSLRVEALKAQLKAKKQLSNPKSKI